MKNPLFDNLFGVHLENDATFIYLLDGQTITYREFLAKSGRIANTFAEIGLKPGDCVAIQVEKSPEMLSIYAACARVGLIFFISLTEIWHQRIIKIVQNYNDFC